MSSKKKKKEAGGGMPGAGTAEKPKAPSAAPIDVLEVGSSLQTAFWDDDDREDVSLQEEIVAKKRAELAVEEDKLRHLRRVRSSRSRPTSRRCSNAGLASGTTTA